MKAVWNGTTLAESDTTVVVEGNHYFPPESIRTEYFRDSDTHTTCPWKGEASYYDVVVDGTGHAPHLQRPHEVARLIRTHEAATPPAGPDGVGHPSPRGR